jgi:hypothetical protein
MIAIFYFCHPGINKTSSITPNKSLLMKNQVLKSLLGLTLIAFAFAGCDLTDDLGVVTFQEELDMTFEVNESGDGQNVQYADSRTLAIASNSTLEPYVNRLEDVKVDRITYRITDFSSSPAGTPVYLNESKVSFGPVDNTTRLFELPVTASANGIDLMATTAETDLNIDQTQLNAVAQLLLNKKQVKMYTEGKLSKIPVSFNVVATVYVTVKAKAL